MQNQFLQHIDPNFHLSSFYSLLVPIKMFPTLPLHNFLETSQQLASSSHMWPSLLMLIKGGKVKIMFRLLFIGYVQDLFGFVVLVSTSPNSSILPIKTCFSHQTRVKVGRSPRSRIQLPSMHLIGNYLGYLEKEFFFFVKEWWLIINCNKVNIHIKMLSRGMTQW